MSRMLWLVYERPPHPDAVSVPATEDDLRFVLEWLSLRYAKRLHLAGQLRNFLGREGRRSPFDRPSVPCRRASGLYRLVPWRLAKWLACVLTAPDAVIARTRSRIETWLRDGTDDTFRSASRQGC
ncbi:MAG: hypothetical protein ACREJB_11425 [Planctomycetaceae bacterium]